MRVGAIARADARGLGSMTRAFCEHMNPDAVLVVKMGRLTHSTEDFSFFEGYDHRVADFDGTNLSEGAIEWLLDRSDVIYTAETPYDYSLLERARAADVRTVVHGMFEFLRWNVEDLPRPDLFLAPSTWRLADWPEPTRFLPVPVDRTRFPFELRTGSRTVHVAGWKAMGDRAGTKLVMRAARYLDAPMTVCSQSPLRAPGVQLRGEVRDPRTLYRDFDIFVAPRRYGGLSLPLNEACSSGLAVVALDREPERSVLHGRSLIPVTRTRALETQGGEIEWCDGDARALADRLLELAEDRGLVAELSRHSNAYAESISWDVMEPRYREMLAEVCEGVVV